MRSYRRAIAVALATLRCLLAFGAWLCNFVRAARQVLADSRARSGRWSGSSPCCWRSSWALLVYTAFTVYSTQQAESAGLGPVVIELTTSSSNVGPNALRGRVRLARGAGRFAAGFFGDVQAWAAGHTFEETRATMHLDEHLFR